MSAPQLSALKCALRHSSAFLSEMDKQPLCATRIVEDLKQAIAVPLPVTGAPAVEVIDHLVEATAGGILGSASGRFFGWVIGGALPSALAADWLVSTWDNNATIAACGPAVAVVEEIAGEWVKRLLELPIESSFAFTTGCQMAHVTCLAAARQSLLRTKGWDVEHDGLFGAPPIRVLASEHHHASLERALRFLGLGEACLVDLRTDDNHRLTAPVVMEALAQEAGPTILVLNAGDLNVGAMDDFATIIPLARQSGAWVHVDGAFGLWARASERHAHLAHGADLADSWATDAHKWLNTPMDTGIAIVRHPCAHRAAMSVGADYLTLAVGVRDQIDWTPDWTRRARGVPVYAAIRELGRDGIAEMIDRCCAMARRLVDGLAAMPGVELVWRPTLNQGLVRFVHPNKAKATPDADDRWTDTMIAAINAEGTAFFSGTSWKGRRCMRISVVNWQTGYADVDMAIAATAKVLAEETRAQRKSQLTGLKGSGGSHMKQRNGGTEC